MRTSQNRIATLILVLVIFEVLFSYYLSYDRIINNGVCISGDCTTVRNSPYATLFGIQLEYIAATMFTLLLILYHINQKLFALGTLIGGMFALYLISLQAFVIKALCSNCLLIDGTMVVIMILTLSQHTYQKHLKGLFLWGH